MEKPKREQPRPHAPPSHRHGRNNPSFSSSLLDAIYRSIDDSDTSTTPSLAPSSADKNRSPPLPLRHRRFFSATTSSEFEFESTTRPRPVLTRSKLIRTEPPPPPPEKKRTGRSIASRIRNLQKSPASASPGARLASFLNAIFAGGLSGSPNKPTPNCSASSCSRSGNRKAVPCCKGVEDLRSTAESDRRRMVELFRGLEEMEEMEDWESVSSSDLFELESLSVIGRFGDELPVYETTSLGENRAIGPGFVV